MIQIGLDLDIFQTLVEAKGPLTVDEVAEKSGADPQLMRTHLHTHSLTHPPHLTLTPT